MPEPSILFVTLGGWDSTHCLRSRQLSEGLARRGWRVRLVAPDTKDNQVQTAQEDNVTLVPMTLFAFIGAMRRVIGSYRPDYIHFLNPELRALLVSTFSGRAQIVGDWEDLHADVRDRGIRRLMIKFADRSMRRRCAKIIVCSRWLHEQMKSSVGKEICYLPYATLPRTLPELPNPFPTPTAVFMGNFNPQFDHDLLLDAVTILKDEGFTPPVQMIGGGPQLTAIKDNVRKLELRNIDVAGFLPWDDMLNRLRWAHVLIFPIRTKISNLARCPFKVFQYAQAKRPVITSAVGEVPRFLHDMAVYVEETPRAYADAIRRLMSQPRLQDIDYGIDRETWDDRANELHKFLLSASQGSTRRN